MPKCPLHQGEKLEPKRKGWFCEECGAIVLGYDSIPAPEGVIAEKQAEPPKPHRPKAHSLPFPISEGTPTFPISRSQPDLLRGDAVTRWALAPGAVHSAKETLRSLASGGISSSLYVRRSGIDDALPLCFARPRRGLLVVGAPGSGKTTLLARLVRQALGLDPGLDQSDAVSDVEEQDIVLFVSGRSAYETEGSNGSSLSSHRNDAKSGTTTGATRLCDVVARCADVQPGQFDSLEQFILHVAKTGEKDPRPRRKMWLVLDGIDEARDPHFLIEALDAFLPVLETLPWVRLVVSMGRSAYDALAARASEHTNAPAGAFASERLWTWFPDLPTGRAVPFLDLRPFDTDEVRIGYEARQKEMGRRACQTGFDDLPHCIQELIRMPLSLHLFHEAFRGKRTPPALLDEPSLVDAFLDSPMEDASAYDRTLTRLARAMLRRRRPDLPLEIAEQWKSEWTSMRADRRTTQEKSSSIDPVSMLVRVPGLMVADEVGHGHERGQVAWRFVHGRLAEQVLLRELLASIAPRTIPTADEVLEWAKTAAGTDRESAFGTLIGALEALVARMVVRGECSFTNRLLDIEDQTTRARLVRSTLLALSIRSVEEEEELPIVSKALDSLAHAAMLRNRSQRLLSASWRPLHEVLGGAASPAIKVMHRKLHEVSRAAHNSDDPLEEQLPHATTLLALAEVASLHGDEEDAHQYLEEGIQLLAISADSKGASDALRSGLAAGYRKMAEVERSRNQVRRAARSLEASLRVSSTMDNDLLPLPPGQHQERLLSLLAMGDLMQGLGSPEEAEQAYEEALRACLAALVEAPHRSDLRAHRAAALLGLAEVANQTDRLETACSQLEASLSVLRKLTRREPQRWDYQLRLVDVSIRLACLLRFHARDQEACQLYEEAAAVMLALVHAHPGQRAWRSQLVVSLADLGVLMRQVGEDEPARACLEDAAQHGRLLKDDEKARQATASALMSLVQLDEVEGRRFEAHKHVDEALVLLRELSSEAQTRAPRRCLALALLARSRLAAEDGDTNEATAHINKAIRILSELVAVAPDDVLLQHDLGAMVNGLRYLGGGGRVRRIPKHRFSAVVRESGGAEIREFFDREEITVGRAPGNDLMLPNYSVSRHHAIVKFLDGGFIIEDLDSKNGIRVDGARITAPTRFGIGTQVELGDFVLVFEGPIDTSYGSQWSGMLSDAPTGYPPPVRSRSLGEPEKLLETLVNEAQEDLRLELNDILEIDETMKSPSETPPNTKQ